MDLVIMAAGMGSRFGGLKQIEPVNSNNEFLIDYSIFDAVKMGFDRVVFIIKKENYEIFKSTVGKRIESKIKVAYVFQEQNCLPQGFNIIENRVKPLGTGHAIWCLKDVVKGDFAIINSDDFYGRDAFKIASEYLNQPHNSNEMCLVGYDVKNTLSENGATKRGVCSVDEKGFLKNIDECSVEKIDGQIVAKTLSNGEQIKTDSNTIVSMNMFALTPKIFEILENDFKEFLTNLNENNKMTAEFLIPEVIKNAINKQLITVVVKKTNASWFGVTYKEDKQDVLNKIRQLTSQKVYGDPVWKE